MNEHKQGELVRHAVDTRLSGLEGNPWLAQRILANAKGEVKVKRKLSVGVMLAFVLILAVAGAIAAVLLSMQQIVEEQAIPMANQYEGEAYTAEDTNLLLKLAEENDIQLSEQTKAQIQAALDKGEGYFKQEILMAMAKAEFGEHPDAWTLEQQKWFDDVCIAIGFVSENEKGIPAGGEDSKLEIIQAANSLIRQRYDANAPLEDTSKYRVGVQYLNGDADGEYPGMYWSISYHPLYLEGAEYWVSLLDDGTVLGDGMRPGIQATSTVRDILDSYSRIYKSSPPAWTQETLRSFRDACMNAVDKNSRAYLCLEQTAYPDVPANAISKEQAFTLANEYLGLGKHIQGSACLIGADPNPVWKVRITHGTEQRSVEVDCITGEVKTTRLLDSNHRKWWMQMVLWEVSDAADADWVEEIPPSVG